jgi:hypothetical protein
MMVEQPNKPKLCCRKSKACTIQAVPNRDENSRQEEQVKQSIPVCAFRSGDQPKRDDENCDEQSDFRNPRHWQVERLLTPLAGKAQQERRRDSNTEDIAHDKGGRSRDYVGETEFANRQQNRYQ